MSIPAHSVVVSHPAKQHVYQVVLALERAGLLRQFITGIYFKPNRFPYTMIRWLPAVGQVRLSKELRKRYFEELQGDLIISVPYFEILSKITRKMPFISDEMRLWVHLFANWLHDLYVSHWITRCHPQPSIVYGFEGSSLLSFRAAKRLGVITVLDVPIMVNARDIMNKEAQLLGIGISSANLEKRIRNRFREELFLADQIVSPSQAVAESIVGRNISSDKVRVLPFGVDTLRFQPRWMAEARAVHQKFNVLFVGKFSALKGVHYLLEAWQQLTLPNSELIIVGPVTNNEFAQKMRTRYKGKFIEYGNVPDYTIADVFSKADIFVFPSLCEGSALVTYEALASGLPCVVTQEAGSVVRDGIEGFVVPAYDVKTLEDRILRLYKDENLRWKMAVAARRRAEEFTWQNYHARLVNSLDIDLHGQ